MEASEVDATDVPGPLLSTAPSHRPKVVLMGPAGGGKSALLYSIERSAVVPAPDDESPSNCDLPPFSGRYAARRMYGALPRRIPEHTPAHALAALRPSTTVQVCSLPLLGPSEIISIDNETRGPFADPAAQRQGATHPALVDFWDVPGSAAAAQQQQHRCHDALRGAMALLITVDLTAVKHREALNGLGFAEAALSFAEPWLAAALGIADRPRPSKGSAVPSQASSRAISPVPGDTPLKHDVEMDLIPLVSLTTVAVVLTKADLIGESPNQHDLVLLRQRCAVIARSYVPSISDVDVLVVSAVTGLGIGDVMRTLSLAAYRGPSPVGTQNNNNTELTAALRMPSSSHSQRSKYTDSPNPAEGDSATPAIPSRWIAITTGASAPVLPSYSWSVGASLDELGDSLSPRRPLLEPEAAHRRTPNPSMSPLRRRNAGPTNERRRSAGGSSSPDCSIC